MVGQSNEFYINMKQRDIPPYSPSLSFEEQEESTQQFWLEETRKLREGITIDGVFVHPWLYWHLNFWPVMIDDEFKGRIKGIAQLRDNEWFFAENYAKAEREKKGLIMFGTRRFGKALLNSELVYTKNGARRISEISVGDYIYDESGKLVQVIGVYPQGVVRTYKITFDDGREIVSCKDHMWSMISSGIIVENSTEGLTKFDYRRLSLPPIKPVDGKPERDKQLFAPDFLGSLIGSYLLYGGDLMFDSVRSYKYLLYSAYDRQLFMRSLMDFTFDVGEIGHIPVGDWVPDVIRKFILSMARSLGYYAKDCRKTIFIDKERTAKVEKIEPYGSHRCTCIAVDNLSKLFLTTDYTVTHNSVIMSSILAKNATMTFNNSHSVMGFSQTDLNIIGSYLEFGFDNLPYYLRVGRTSNDWEKGVTLGVRMSDNKRIVHASIVIQNIAMGRKTSTQKGAGQTPSTFIMDEIGKGGCMRPYEAARPGFSTPYGMRLVPILAGTGGEVELSSDAQKMINNPEMFGLITMDWDLLNKHTKNPTWRIRKSGVFVPGQMAHSEWTMKDKKTLAEYLNNDGPNLKKIEILTTNFDRSTKNLEDHLDELKKAPDKTPYNLFKMYYPKDLDDCFLSEFKSSFPVEALVSHKNDLLETSDTGLYVDLFQRDNLMLGWNPTEKGVAPYPYDGGVFDACVKIFEAPVSNNFRDYIYTAGLDPYKHAKSLSSSSLGAFYIYKRHVGINDPYANCVVASYVSRPSSIDAFCRVCEMLQEGYGAVCLQENADIMYETYLKVRSKEAALLAYGDDVSMRYGTSKRRQSNPFGLSPTVKNQALIMNCVIQYCNEEIFVGYDDNGEPIKKLGCTRIKDLELIDELVNYYPGGNFDRIIAFGHSLVLAKYYDDMNLMPRSGYERAEEEAAKKLIKRQQVRMRGYIDMSNRNPYR